MIISPTNFLDSLARWIVTRAAALSPAITIQYASVPRQLWILGVDETQPSNVADPYTVLKIYGGPALNQSGARLNVLNVQSQTVSIKNEAGLEAAFNVYRSLFATDSRDISGSDGMPVRMVTITGYIADSGASSGTYLLHHIDALQRPGMTGRDAKGRSLWTFNMEIGVDPRS